VVVGGGNAWPVLSADEELGMIYMSVGSPASDFYGGNRQGANHYTSSLVAVDTLTGNLSWFFQTVHHDIWDTDLAGQPSIFKAGSKKIVAVGTKAAHIWLLDAQTGKPIFGYEERPVEKSDVPGEQTSPTQPYPLPPSLSLLPDNAVIWGPNEDGLQYCKDFIANFLTGSQGMHRYTPISINGSILYPGVSGGINFGGCAANSLQGTFTCVVKTESHPVKMFKKENPPDSWCDRIFRETDTPYYMCWNYSWRSPGGYPCLAPPWTELVMVNATSGQVIWRRPLGFVPNPDFNKNWGSIFQRGGVTETLGGLLFVAGTADNSLWVFDSVTGNEIFSIPLPYSATSTPITYRINNVQYVTIQTSNNIMSWTIRNNSSPQNMEWIYGVAIGLGSLVLCVIITVAVTFYYNKRRSYIAVEN